jgi:predicted regulator of Ras-like GTPase activity (Roadblock/LC7/MglB family)
MCPQEFSTSDPAGSKLRSILRRLNTVSDSIEASAVISGDGLVKASMLGEDIDPDRFGAMCATLLALAKRAATETARGDLKLVLIEGTQGTMLIVQIGEKGVLAIAAKPKSNLGMIFLEARKTAAEIALII